MFDSPRRALFSYSSLHPGDAHNCPQNQLSSLNLIFNGSPHQSHLNQANLTTEHFNDLANTYGVQSFNSPEKSSKSPNRSSRSLLSPRIQINFPELDNFLKETYQKHGIYDLIKSFVDMEEKLVSTFDHLRKNHKKSRRISFSAEKNTRSFEKLNELERFSIEADQAINEFLYDIQCFFLPENVLGMIQNEKLHDFSFSEIKPHSERNLMTSKRSEIENYRPNYIFEDLMDNVQEASSLSLYLPTNNSKRKQHMANPQNADCENHESFFDDESLQSETLAVEKQMELVRMMFDLRRQNLQLKKQMRELNGGDYSHNSLFYFDKPSDINSFSMQLESSKIDDQNILGVIGERPVLKLLNDQAQIHLSKESSLIVKKIQGKEYQNLDKNLKILNELESSCDPEKAQLIFCEKEPQSSFCGKRSKKIESKIVEIVLLPQVHFPSAIDQVEIEEKDKKVVEQELKSVPNNQMQAFERKLKKMLELELKIQMVLMGFIMKKKPISKKVESSFNEAINWLTDMKVREKSKQEGFEKMIEEWMAKKKAILKELHNLYDKKSPCTNN